MIRKQTTQQSTVCDKCGGVVIKEGVMDSGNSRYVKYYCKACNNRWMKCEGPNQKTTAFK
jgi:hypothetical protein